VRENSLDEFRFLDARELVEMGTPITVQGKAAAPLLARRSALKRCLTARTSLRAKPVCRANDRYERARDVPERSIPAGTRGARRTFTSVCILGLDLQATSQHAFPDAVTSAVYATSL
jgi:hypothetical protein